MVHRFHTGYKSSLQNSSTSSHALCNVLQILSISVTSTDEVA